MLAYVNRQHISIPQLEAAMRDLINAYNRLELPKCWGTGKRAAADGSKFQLYENNLMSEYHIRYGGYGGIAYHHVSDTYIALFTHFINCGVWEAVYILDGLLKNTSDIQPDTLHADTQLMFVKSRLALPTLIQFWSNSVLVIRPTDLWHIDAFSEHA
jgi:TnpA family transposase